MAIGDEMNAGLNLNIQAGGAGSVQDMAQRLRNMKDALALTKKELSEAGLRGSAFMKATQDSTTALRNADAAAKSYAAAVAKFGPQSIAATTALKGMKSAMSDVAAEASALQGKLKGLQVSNDSFLSKVSTSGAAALGKWAAGLFSVYTAFNYLKGAFTSAVEFNEKVDKLAVSGARVGLSFQQASDAIQALALSTSRTAGYDQFGVGGSQSVFDQGQVVEGLTKLRDRGVDVFHMTRDDLKPVLDAAVASVQDLGEVSDATGVALQQFGLSVSDTTRVADVMVTAFQVAGLTAAEFSEGVSAAGAVARATGTSLEEYTAVLARLKQLGMSGGTFQKQFFSMLAAPSPEQLATLDRLGVSLYRSSSDFSMAGALGATSSIGALGDMAGRLGFGGIGDTLNRGRLSAARALESGSGGIREQAQAVEDARQKIVALATEQEKLNGAEATFTSLISIQKGQLDALKESQGEWKDRLAATTAALADVKGKFDQLADPRISGMGAFDAKISAAELALKKQQLALLKSSDGTRAYESRIQSLTGKMKDQERALDSMRRRYDEVGQSLDRAKAKAGEYEAKLTSLRSVELRGEGAFGDAQFGLQQQINQLQLQKTQLSPVDLFGANQLDRQIAALQQQLEQSRLQQSVTFDPQRRAIEKAADRAEGKGRPMRAKTVLSQIDDYAAKLDAEREKIKTLEEEHRREAEAIAAKSQEIDGLKVSIDDARTAMDQLSESTRAAEDALNTLKLEKEVAFGEQVFQVKERFREMKEELGLIAEEKPYEELLREIDTLGAKYGELQATRDAEQQKVDEYQRLIDDGSLSLRFYQRRLDDTKDANERLGDELTALSDQFAAMPKVYQSEMEILEQLATSTFTATDAYDLLGKKGAAALVALVGENGENAGKLRELAAAMGTQGNAAESASAASASVLDAAQALAAGLRNLEMQVGTNMAGSMGGLIGALEKLTNVLLDITGIPEKITGHTPIGGVAKAAGLASEGDYLGAAGEAGMLILDPFNLRGFFTGRALGGVVPGYGYNDTEPALLSAGERVLTRQENRAYEAGVRGVTVNITGPVSVRSEQDITRLAAAISRELHQEVRRVRSGMPA